MMKLKRFKKEETKRKKVIKIFGAFIMVGILLSGISYAVYQRETEVTFINAKVGDFKVYLTNITAISYTISTSLTGYTKSQK